MKSAWLHVAAGVVVFLEAIFAQVVLPVLDPSVNTAAIENVIPTTDVTLSYANATDSAPCLNVTLAMKAPTVLLEAVASISVVDCSPTSVDVTFTSADAFSAAQDSWPITGNFTLITNHMGDCDLELERGFFYVTSLTWSTTNLTATARSTAQNISAAADTAEISFGSLSATPLTKRALVLDPTFSLLVNYSLPKDTTLFSYAPYLTVAADSADLNAELTFSGYLKYSFLLFKLEELKFDIDTAFDASVTLSASVGAGYNNTFTYAPSALSYSFVNVPGILSLGPAVTFAIGAQVAASAAVDITTTFSVNLADGNVHVDALDEASSSTSGWVPTYNAAANVSTSAKVNINPFVSLTVELAIDILGGLVDLSSGVTAKPTFNNEFLFTAAGGVDLTGVGGLNSSGDCSQGLAIQSDFEFEVDLFVTEFYRTKLYEFSAEIANVCYAF